MYLVLLCVGVLGFGSASPGGRTPEGLADRDAAGQGCDLQRLDTEANRGCIIRAMKSIGLHFTVCGVYIRAIRQVNMEILVHPWLSAAATGGYL